MQSFEFCGCIMYRLVRSSDIQHVRRPAPQAHAEAQHNRMFMACASSNDGDTSPTASDPTYDLDDLGTAKNALDLGLGLCKEERQVYKHD